MTLENLATFHSSGSDQGAWFGLNLIGMRYGVADGGLEVLDGFPAPSNRCFDANSQVFSPRVPQWRGRGFRGIAVTVAVGTGRRRRHGGRAHCMCP